MKAHAVRLAVVVCAAAFGLAAARSAEAQSYPKLLVNGHGLALTRLAVQEKAGASWVASATVRQGVQHRLVLRLTNFYRNTWAASTHLTDTFFNVTLPGSTFYPNSQFYGSGTPGQYRSSPDRTPLPPTKSRSYYVYFKWNGPPMAAPSLPILVGIDGWEMVALPNMSGVLVRPTS